ncbi:MAG: M17 family peptidase N-terminal domain-containing protein, partial [Syntrophales bacterium]|nr:M17 family peptidase N-terminal domain-containing protein [Syntrophales bacterium]
MEIEVKKGNLASVAVDAIVLFIHEDGGKGKYAELIDGKCRGLISEFMKTGDFEGKLNQTSVLYTRDLLPAKRIIIAGMGKKAELTLDKLRGVTAKAAQQARCLRLKSFSVSIDHELFGYPLSDATEAFIEGVELGLYQFTPFKTVDRDKIKTVDKLIIVEEDRNRLEVIK